MASRLKKLCIFCFEIITKSKNIFVQFTFSIDNQQLIFTFAIAYSLYNNDNDNNGSKPLILNRISKFSNGIPVKKQGN
jgi:hypothetical protein